MIITFSEEIGSGKSTIGKELAKKLNYSLIIDPIEYSIRYVIEKIILVTKQIKNN
ncbi:MAG: hypothetical protein DRP06_00730 [Candidatus Aenigmatarchaeota archaeon]|nr:MAG: hypothetical protein DRP06_00730 [Candidatus Aenigmarchaeota archaeon]